MFSIDCSFVLISAINHSLFLHHLPLAYRVDREYGVPCRYYWRFSHRMIRVAIHHSTSLSKPSLRIDTAEYKSLATIYSLSYSCSLYPLQYLWYSIHSILREKRRRRRDEERTTASSSIIHCALSHLREEKERGKRWESRTEWVYLIRFILISDG